MFHSMNTIVITVVLLTALVSMVILKQSVHRILMDSVQTLLKNKKMLLHFIAMLLILVFNKFEQTIAKEIKVGDFTPVVHMWEGNIVYYLQKLFMNDTLTTILTFFYIIVFPVLLVSSIVIYIKSKDYKSYYAFVYALMLNYLIAVPFYLFFPVYEVWYYDPRVTFLIPDIYPNFELEYRPLSGIDNNFPSLHTSISLTIAMIAMSSKKIEFGKLALFSAGIIVFSTMYLGIHWLADLTAGILLAVLASQTGIRLAEHTLGERPFHPSDNTFMHTRR